MLNECILLGLCYHFILFIDPIWDRDLKDQVGTTAIVLISTLLGINGLVILIVTIQSLKRKFELRKLKKIAEAE